MKTYFDNIQQVLSNLNQDNVDYLILRNYENLLDDSIYVGGHEDIDILCENPKSVIDTLGAISNRKIEDYTHYHIFVGSNRVNIDIRHVGDGYYCEKWQRDMLSRKQKYDCFYVMTDQDYYYSLIYHAIIQKKKFSEEYRLRLKIMSEKIGDCLSWFDQSSFVKSLENYMRNNQYKFVYLEDPSVPLKFNLVSRDLIEIDRERKRKHMIFIIKYAYKRLKKVAYCFIYGK